MLVAGSVEILSVPAAEAVRIFTILSTEVSAKAAVTLTAEITGLSRNDVYRLTRVPD